MGEYNKTVENPQVLENAPKNMRFTLRLMRKH
jgi:hypothetical protein